VQIVTNQQFVKNRTRIAKFGTLLGFAGMGVGFVASLNPEFISVAYVCLIIGLFAFNVGRYNAIRWGSRPREDEVLANALKGLDQKYVLVNYAPELPSGHVLLSPFGLFHIETRHNDGGITCQGDKWSRSRSWFALLRGLSEGQLGNPTRSAQAASGRLSSFLTERFGEEVANQVPVEGVVVFMSPRVDLKVSDAVVPGVTPGDLKACVRAPQGRAKLSPEVYRRLQDAFASVNGNGKSANGDAKGASGNSKGASGNVKSEISHGKGVNSTAKFEKLSRKGGK